MSQYAPDPEMTAIESALGALVPVPSRLDRDHLMFEAGARSALRSTRGRLVWPSIAALLALVVASESMMLASRPSPRVVERLVVAREPSPPRAEETPTPSPAPKPDAAERPPSPVVLEVPITDPPAWATASEYLCLQDMVLRFGLDALPEPAPPARPLARANPLESGSESAGALRRLELERLLNPGGPS